MSKIWPESTSTCTSTILCAVCVRATKALVRLRVCAGSPVHSLLADALSTQCTCDGPCTIYSIRFCLVLFILSLIKSSSIYPMGLTFQRIW